LISALTCTSPTSIFGADEDDVGTILRGEMPIATAENRVAFVTDLNMIVILV
jgi:hypothetical protein